MQVIVDTGSNGDSSSSRPAEMLGVRSLSRLLGISAGAILSSRYRRSGLEELQGYRLYGKRLFFRADDVSRWIAERACSADPLVKRRIPCITDQFAPHDFELDGGEWQGERAKVMPIVALTTESDEFRLTG